MYLSWPKLYKLKFNFFLTENQKNKGLLFIKVETQMPFNSEMTLINLSNIKTKFKTHDNVNWVFGVLNMYLW